MNHLYTHSLISSTRTTTPDLTPLRPRQIFANMTGTSKSPSMASQDDDLRTPSGGTPLANEELGDSINLDSESTSHLEITNNPKTRTTSARTKPAKDKDPTGAYAAGTFAIFLFEPRAPSYDDHVLSSYLLSICSIIKYFPMSLNVPPSFKQLIPTGITT